MVAGALAYIIEDPHISSKCVLFGGFKIFKIFKKLVASQYPYV